MRKSSKMGLLALSLCAGLILPGQASASFVLNFSTAFPGADKPDPAGSPPWLTATFTNNGADHVTLTLAANLQLSSEFVRFVYFNVNPSSLLDLTISPVNIGAVSSASWTQDANNLKADGDGKYDIRLDLPTGGDRFQGAEMLVFDLSATGLTENSFNDLSVPDGGSGPFLAAAHIQGIATDPPGSTWIYATTGNNPVVPEPATILSAVTGLVSMGFFGLRRRRQAADIAA
jgi:hypothetical protein